jgi:hypothetical protein
VQAVQRPAPPRWAQSTLLRQQRFPRRSTLPQAFPSRAAVVCRQAVVVACQPAAVAVCPRPAVAARRRPVVVAAVCPRQVVAAYRRQPAVDCPGAEVPVFRRQAAVARPLPEGQVAQKSCHKRSLTMRPHVRSLTRTLPVRQPSRPQAPVAARVPVAAKVPVCPGARVGSTVARALPSTS